MRADSIQDLSYSHNSSLGKGFAFESPFRHRSGSEDISKDLFNAKENSILPSKPNAAFNLGDTYFPYFHVPLSIKVFLISYCVTGEEKKILVSLRNVPHKLILQIHALLVIS